MWLFFQYKSFDFIMYIGLDSSEVERKKLIHIVYMYLYEKK